MSERPIQELRDEVSQLRVKLARAEDALQRREHAEWLQFQRERDEALKTKAPKGL